MKCLAHLEKHELVQRIIPLHEENSIWNGTTKVCVAIVWISTHTAFVDIFCLRDFECGCKSLRDKSFWDTIYVQGQSELL